MNERLLLTGFEWKPGFDRIGRSTSKAFNYRPSAPILVWLDDVQGLQRLRPRSAEGPKEREPIPDKCDRNRDVMKVRFCLRLRSSNAQWRLLGN